METQAIEVEVVETTEAVVELTLAELSHIGGGALVDSLM
jgi:hypothetical protein